MPRKVFLPSYFTTRFRGDRAVRGLRHRDFAIISAYSPPSERWPRARNERAFARLRHRVHRWRFFDLVGYAPDNSHLEKSVAVPCSLRIARKIAREFRQDAIYWVTDGRLWLIDTAGRGRPPTEVGAFFPRFRSVPT